MGNDGVPPLEAILDGSGVRYYSKRTRQLTPLEKKLEAAREAFQAARRDRGLPDAPKTSPGYGAAPPGSRRATAAGAKTLRQELRRRAYEAGARMGLGGAASGPELSISVLTGPDGLVTSPSRSPGASGAPASALRPAITGLASGRQASGTGAGLHATFAGSTGDAAGDDDWRRFADSLAGASRGPVVTSKPYHTEARTMFNLSLLPTSVSSLQADSGLYYCPAGSGAGGASGGGNGFKAALRDGMIRYFEPNLTRDQAERRRIADEEMAARLARATAALHAHIEAIVARWGPGFLDRLVANAALASPDRFANPTHLHQHLRNQHRHNGATVTGVAAPAPPVPAVAGGPAGPAQHGERRGSVMGAGQYGAQHGAQHAAQQGPHHNPWVPLMAQRGPAMGLHGKPRVWAPGREPWQAPPARLSVMAHTRLVRLAEHMQVPVDSLLHLLRKHRRRSTTASGGTDPGQASPLRLSEGGMLISQIAQRAHSTVVGVVGAHQGKRVELMGGPKVTLEEAAALRAAQQAEIAEQLRAQQQQQAEREASGVGAEVESLHAWGDDGDEEGAAAAAAAETAEVEAAAAVAAVLREVAEAGEEPFEREEPAQASPSGPASPEPAEGDPITFDAQPGTEGNTSAAMADGGQLLEGDPSSESGFSRSASVGMGMEPSFGLALTHSSGGAQAAADGQGGPSPAPTAAPVTNADARPVPGAVMYDAVGRSISPRRMRSLLRPQPSGRISPATGAAAAAAIHSRGVIFSRRAAAALSRAATAAASPRRTPPLAAPAGSDALRPGTAANGDGAGVGADGDAAGAADSTDALPISETAAAVAMGVSYHHRSGLSFVALVPGRPMPQGPSLEELQPVDPHKAEREAKNMAVLETLSRRHGSPHQQLQPPPPMSTTDGSIGVPEGLTPPSTAPSGSRLGTADGDRAGRRQRTSAAGGDAAAARPHPHGHASSGHGPSAGTPPVGGGGAGTSRGREHSFLRRPRSQPYIVQHVRPKGQSGGGAAHPGTNEAAAGVVEERLQAEGEDDGETSGDGGGGERPSGSRRNSRAKGDRVARASRPRSREKGGRRSRSTTPPHAGSVSDGPIPESPGTAAAAARAGAPRHRSGSAAAGSPGSPGLVRSGLLRLTQLAGSVGLTVGDGARRRRGIPGNTLGLVESSDEEDMVELGQRADIFGDDEADQLVQGGWLGTAQRPSHEGEAGPVGMGRDGPVTITLGPLPTWDSRPASAAAAAAKGAAGRGGGSGGGNRPGTAESASVALDAGAESDGGTPGSPQLVQLPRSGLPTLAESAPSTPLHVQIGSARASALGMVLPPPAGTGAGADPDAERGLSRHYKQVGQRWNPAAPGALRPGYGTEADYTAGTYNPELMEHVASARLLAQATGEDMCVLYVSPVHAGASRGTAGAGAGAGGGGPSRPATVATPSGARGPRISGDSVSVHGGSPPPSPTRGGAPQPLPPATPEPPPPLDPARTAATAIAGFLNPILRAITDVTTAAASRGVEPPAPLQVLIHASGASAHMSSPVATPSRAGRPPRTPQPRPATTAPPGPSPATAAAAQAVAKYLVLPPRSASASADFSAGLQPEAPPLRRPPTAPDAASREPVESRRLCPSQSVWGREELDEHDILLPLNQLLSATNGGAPSRAATALGGSRRSPAAPASALAAALAANNRRASTAPAGARTGTSAGGAAAAPAGPPPAPEPRLWRGDPLDLGRAFPASEKMYRMTTDAAATARLIREVERDITPLAFRTNLRKGVVL